MQCMGGSTRTAWNNRYVFICRQCGRRKTILRRDRQLLLRRMFLFAYYAIRLKRAMRGAYRRQMIRERITALVVLHRKGVTEVDLRQTIIQYANLW